MKNFILIILCFAFVTACNTTTQTAGDSKEANVTKKTAKKKKGGHGISGQILGLRKPDTKIKLALSNLNNTIVKMGETTADAEGKYEIKLEAPFKPGMYVLTIGFNRISFPLDGTENQVSFNANINKLFKYQVEMEGSETAASYIQLMNDFTAKKIITDSLHRYAQSQNSMAGMAIAKNVIAFDVKRFEIIKAINTNIQSEYPDTRAATDFQKKTDELEKSFAQMSAARKSTAGLKIGDPAPEIALKGVDLKTEYKLSDLKGKVVLIDFWASWCGPCRKANPHVVEVYNKYKDQGFTVYSVSLDGIDSRSAAKIGDVEAIEERRMQTVERWKKAIDQDGLIWDSHVSTLKKWDCEVARQYGVRSIPRTFLLDKEGKVAALNPRHDLEKQVARLMQ